MCDNNMKNFVLFILLFFTSCVTFIPVAEEFQPLHLRLLSSNDVIKAAAIDEFDKLKNKEQIDVQLRMVELLEKEEMPEKRIKILNMLQELKADHNVIIPLIYAVSKNSTILEYKEIIYFLVVTKTDKDTVRQLLKLLNDKNWIVVQLALVSLASNPEESKIAIPEMVDTMKRYIGDREKYFKIFDIISMVNPEVSILSLIKDFKNKDSKIRQEIFEKLIELQVFLGSKLEVKKEILPALIRGLYDEDNNISKMAQETLKEINDPVAKKALESYLNMGKVLFDSFMKLTGKSMQDFFKSQDTRIDNRLKEIYKSIGREDAVK